MTYIMYVSENNKLVNDKVKEPGSDKMEISDVDRIIYEAGKTNEKICTVSFKDGDIMFNCMGEWEADDVNTIKSKFNAGNLWKNGDTIIFRTPKFALKIIMTVEEPNLNLDNSCYYPPTIKRGYFYEIIN